MSDASAPASPLEVTTPLLPLVAAAPAAAAPAAPVPALSPPALSAPALLAPALPVPTARTVGNLQIACKYSCFPFADSMLTLTDRFRTLSCC
jgi:hypothetical protein